MHGGGRGGGAAAPQLAPPKVVDALAGGRVRAGNDREAKGIAADTAVPLAVASCSFAACACCSCPKFDVVVALAAVVLSV